MTDVTLTDLKPADFATLSELAHRIWRAHYAALVPIAQIDYMLASRCAPENLQRYVDADDRWLHLLRVDGTVVGYCSYACTDVPGEMKLEQLYLLPEFHGRGLGGRMLRHVEAQARALGRDSVMLTVNKRNAGAIAVYAKAGYVVREEVVFDIGEGHRMDDYVMAKTLGNA